MNINQNVNTIEKNNRLHSIILFAHQLDEFFEKNPAFYIIAVEALGEQGVLVVYRNH